jgi:hypothetical protein
MHELPCSSNPLADELFVYSFPRQGGAIANVVVAGTKVHPKRDRPLIDWTLITVMEPLAVAG